MPPGMGGSNLVHLVQARLASGLPTDVITLDPTATSFFSRYDGDLLRLWVIQKRSRRALRDGYRRETNGILQALQESQPDLCHAHWTYEYGLAALRQRQAPALVSIHDHAGNLLRQVGWRFLPHYGMSRHVIVRAPLCTAVSPYIADYVETLRGVRPPVVPNVLTPSPNPVKPKVHRSSCVVSLLSALEYKNTKTALKAFALVRGKHPELRYHLAGPGLEAGGPVEAWARQQGLLSGVLFKGRLPYTEAQALLKQASILLHPSLEESFGSPVAEAMGMGIPVLAAREAGGPAWLCAQNRGTLVAGKDVQAMARALEDLWMGIEGNSTVLKKTVDSARDHIYALCSPEAVLAQWNTVYRECLSKPT